jgi:alpha-amylase
MKKICLIIEVHQPMKLETYRFFDIMSNHYYYNDYENEYYIKDISEKYYLPANKILHDLIHLTKNNFKISFLFSGIVLDQFELYNREVIDSYISLLDTGCVELLSGTYSNVFGPTLFNIEYNNQIKLQKDRIKSVFGRNPVNFTLRDLNNSNCLHTFPGIKIQVRGKKSDKIITYRVDKKHKKDWFRWPEELFNILDRYNKEGYNMFNIFIPYNISVDSHNGKGILQFLEIFPTAVITNSDFTFDIPSENIPDSDAELQTEFNTEGIARNLEFFYANCNELQLDAFQKLYSQSEKMKICDDPLINKDWLYLQAGDHFHFMNPLLYRESYSFRHILPYSSQFLAYINYMNILTDFSGRLDNWLINNDRNLKDHSEIYREYGKKMKESIIV